MPRSKKSEQSPVDESGPNSDSVAVVHEQTPEAANQDENLNTAGDQSGDGGAREREIATAMGALEGLSEDLNVGDDAGAIVATLTDHIVEMFKHRPKPWSQLNQSEQRDLCAAAEANAKETVRQVVEAVARNGREAIRCLCVGFTDKGEDIKVELKVKAMSKEETESGVLALHRARGKLVLVTIANPDDYHDKPATDHSEPDQPALGFEAGSDTVTGEDLATIKPTGEPAKDPKLEDEIHTGDRVIMAKNGICEARVNLKTEMVEALPPGAELEDGWVDVRPATPGELAAERDRIADFDEEEDEAEAAEA